MNLKEAFDRFDTATQRLLDDRGSEEYHASREALRELVTYGPSIDPERMADHFTKYHLRGPWPFHPVIHHISAPDHGDPHDHPWPFRSVILHGWYLEERFLVRKNHGSIGVKERREGDSFEIKASTVHHIVEVSPGGCWTLIIPGEPERTPGFYQFRKDGTYRRDWDGDWELQA